jgi:hypothetical protein
MLTRPITYAGSAPGANSNTYTLFDSTAVPALSGSMQNRGYNYYVLGLVNSHVGTLKGYASRDAGATWLPTTTTVVPPTPAFTVPSYPYRIDLYPDVKFEWVNGGSAQTTWAPFQILTDDVDNPTEVGHENTSYLTNGDMSAATVTGSAIRVGPMGSLILQIQWLSTSSPVGTFSLEYTSDGTAWKTVPNSSAGFSSHPASNAGDIVCFWRQLRAPGGQGFKYVRLKYTRSGGGAAATLAAQHSTW